MFILSHSLTPLSPFYTRAHLQVLHLRSLGFRVDLIHYCPQEISPENALLVAYRPRPVPGVIKSVEM